MAKTRTANWDYQRQYTGVPERSQFTLRWHQAVKEMQEVNPDWETWYTLAPARTNGEMLPLILEHNLLIADAQAIVAERAARLALAFTPTAEDICDMIQEQASLDESDRQAEISFARCGY